jgi:hypothetical protein
MTDIQLKPCPFCGGKAEWCDCGVCPRIVCTKCGLMVEWDGRYEEMFDPDLDKCKKFNAKLWNGRP